MGGRGASAGGGSGGGVLKSSVMTQSGQMADLGGLSLQYGDKDPAITGNLRSALEAQEAKRLKNKIEYGAMYDADGNMIDEVKGGSSGMKVPTILLNNSEVFTHNHPRGKDEEGLIGGTFSTEDIDTWTGTRSNTFRASATEGTYSITRGSNFNARGLNSYYNQIHSDADSRRRQANIDAADRCSAGQITYSQYLSQRATNFNRMLVECHNGLLAGQSQYGYHYTLEERQNG